MLSLCDVCADARVLAVADVGTAPRHAQCPRRCQSRGAGRVDLSLEPVSVKTFLGVDGGGTKTDFLLIDESGRVLASHRWQSAYQLATGAGAPQGLLVAG